MVLLPTRPSTPNYIISIFTRQSECRSVGYSTALYCRLAIVYLNNNWTFYCGDVFNDYKL